VIKRALAGNRESAELSAREVELYRKHAPALGSPPVVRCLAAIEATATEPACLALEDLRGTHTDHSDSEPLSDRNRRLAVEALARVHARFWEAAELGAGVGTLHTVESVTRMVQGVGAWLAGFFAAAGDDLSADGRATMERAFGSALRPWLRIVDRRCLTLAHGDAHTGNLLFPSSGAGSAYLLDWQLWHLDVGAHDLAFLIALHWDPTTREAHELPMLHHYHDRLVSSGCGTIRSTSSGSTIADARYGT